MQRHKATWQLIPGQGKEIKHRMLDWAKQFSILLFLDSNNYKSHYGRYECLLGAGATAIIGGNHGDLLTKLQQLHDTHRDWIFGHIGYDYKNVLEPDLSSSNAAEPGFPLLHFFIPQTVCHIDPAQTTFTIESFDDPQLIYEAITATTVTEYPTPLPALRFTKVTNKHTYLATIVELRRHIADGDCYELNYCNKGYCVDAAVAPLQVYKALSALSPAPFAAWYRLHNSYMMCASPERYLRKDGGKLLAQPIKGTARRDKDPGKDIAIKEALRNDIKERAENVMIVDLMRNDLAHCSETGSVAVDELFGIYSFPQVHQMISSVTSTIKTGLPFTDAIRNSFPMGSMTGAPKYKAMQLIDKYEEAGRGLFSGTVGYITAGGDFDFNVIIRSLFYDNAAHYLSYQAGGAITFDSDAEKEWEEMRLKSWALERIFS